ncbi:MAG TPA: undecaprenyl-diphosphatase UppP [Anaerolineales bacterium]|jgi:undecaprenyl-diphosphatase|nr:undecaprenyl-diphosphatase UppP [Anaerolineales bacterium]
MNVFQSILLGIVQGLTEFIPVSSSGHLVLVPYLFGWKIPPDQAFVFDVLVQVATLVGVFAFFWRDITAIIKAMFAGALQRQPFGEPMARLGWYVVLATIPAGLVGFLIKDTIEAFFNSPIYTALFLLFTAFLLIIAERVGKRSRNLDSMTWKDALLIGFFQVLALFPGVSRSGATISGAMRQDFERPAGARFSFIMSIPIMFAAGFLSLSDLKKFPDFTQLLPVFIPGFITAGIVGYLVIGWLLNFLSRYPLYYFAAYCVALSILTFVVSLTIL